MYRVIVPWYCDLCYTTTTTHHGIWIMTCGMRSIGHEIALLTSAYRDLQVSGDGWWCVLSVCVVLSVV